MELLCVPPDRNSEFWPIAKSHIFGSPKLSGLVSEADVEKNVLAGRRQIWLATENSKFYGAIITHLFTDGIDRICEVTAMGALPHAAKNHFKLIERIEEFARAEGCITLRIIGRQGWKRALPDYEPKALILEKAL